MYASFGTIILFSFSNIILAKPLVDDKPFGDENKLRCMDSNEGLDYEKSNPNTFSEYYKPHARFESSEKSFNQPFEYDKKRSASDDLYSDTGNSPLQKRQVGVVYSDERPIGILQPYQRSYRFIPVKEEKNLYGLSNQAQDQTDFSYNLPSLADVDKRETNNVPILDPGQLEEIYPSILTNFKIVNKLDKKRNYDTLTDENVRDLKATIRRLRSSNSHNNEQIEEELKNILDDMGLIEDEESHGEKREATDDQKDDENVALLGDEAKTDGRSKRDEACIRTENFEPSRPFSEQNFLSTEEKKNEIKSDPFSRPSTVNKRESTEDSQRKKRQKQEVASDENKENSELVENIKDSGDIMVSGNKSPLASSSDITIRETEKEGDKPYDDENDDYERRVERQIQSKINSLKEEVKREIEALKKRQSNNDDDDEDMQRKKRQVLDNLINEETDELNPAMNPDVELKPLIRKRRYLKSESTNVEKVRKKRETKFSYGSKKKRSSDHATDIRSSEKNYKSGREESDEGGELLGGDDFNDGAVLKREVYKPNEEYETLDNENSNLNGMLYGRDKRSGILTNNDLGLYDNYLYNNYFYNGRLKRQNYRQNNAFEDRSIPLRTNRWRSRFRRRINDNNVMGNRPQQLSDMSDLDLFGALPKSYDGELSRYKRVK